MMTTRVASLALAAILAGSATQASAQTVRFQTSVGAFDMLLNPTNNADLQPHVDNMLANVAAGVYHGTVLNRAVDDFVLQMGSFQTETRQLSEIPQFGFEGTKAFDPVIVDALPVNPLGEDGDGQVDFDTTNLNNTVGTVSLALSANPNTGSASFFVNLTDNTFLDNQGFVPFAEIPDMTVIDRIMGLDMVDISSDVLNPNNGLPQTGSLAYTDVPLDQRGELVVIETATVISDSNLLFVGPLRTAFGLDDLPLADETVNEGESDLAAFSASESISAEPVSAAAVAVPEPAALGLALGALLLVSRRR